MRKPKDQIRESHTTSSEILGKLSEPFAPNFFSIAQDIQTLNLSEQERKELAIKIVEKIQQVLSGGHFNDLRGAKEALESVGINGVEFSNDWTNRVANLYERFPQGFLLGLSHPPLYEGKLVNGQEYNRNEDTRQKLKKFGANEDELSDNFIDFLWSVREILILMHNRLVRIDNRLALNTLLMLGE